MERSSMAKIGFKITSCSIIPRFRMSILGTKGFFQFWKMRAIPSFKLLSLRVCKLLFFFFSREALFIMAICHSIVTDEKSGEIVYNAASPDELAIINFAKFCGVNYIGTDYDSRKIISFHNQTFRF